jgi:hypothetical protein
MATLSVRCRSPDRSLRRPKPRSRAVSAHPGEQARTVAPSRQAGGHWFEPSTAHQIVVSQTNTRGVFLAGVVVEGVLPRLPVEDLVASDVGCDQVANGRTEERAERFGEIGADATGAFDVDALEEGLIDLASKYSVRSEIRGVAVLQEPE